MSECDFMRESMPLLLTESLDPVRREHTHQHIEHCSLCSDEWTAYQETWRTLELLPEVEVPARVKDRFLAQIAPEPKSDNVVPFRRRPALKWIAQAAAVVVIAGGSYFMGHRSKPVVIAEKPAIVNSIQPYSIAESKVLPASLINPNIEAIQETKITSQNYDAEFGQATAGVVSVQTKSGTNSLRGSASEFHLDDRFQARNPF